ncbi:hypothetical protein QAD02_014372 [Eretmocerus hayati]|uniref:Uncharacterized protein n=1 Tax=Eretmocerus hayati TaxID=131215 RepID=A0ACC2P9X8_9HYME|nr:hypothetical protein QAD02_014372 [Eretmocerus hayati]
MWVSLRSTNSAALINGFISEEQDIHRSDLFNATIGSSKYLGDSIRLEKRQTDAPVEEIKDDSTVPLDPEDLKILGEPTAKENNESLLHVDVRTLWKNLVLTGLDEEPRLDF